VIGGLFAVLAALTAAWALVPVFGLKQISQNATVRWLHHDQLGSTTSITNATTIQTYTYDAYGQLTSTPPTTENPFRFTGQYTDNTTGLQYLRARYYDPTTGQFLSRDPLEDTTLQPYAYAANAPTTGTDPTGLSVTTDFSDAVSTVVPPSVSDAAAWTLDLLTANATTNIACNGLTWNNTLTASASIAMTFIPAGRIGKLGEQLATKGGGALSRLGSRLADETGSAEVRAIGRGGSRLTNAQATDLADWLGYRSTGQTLRGEKVFTDGKRFIVQDTTSHSGGVWKMAKSPGALNSRTSGVGTYGEQLNYVGP
jgi:RHS repeat-associated protein